MPLEINCPSCGKQLRVLEKLAGQDRATKASADNGDGDRGRATLLGSGFHYAPWLPGQILPQYVYNVYYISRLR